MERSRRAYVEVESDLVRSRADVASLMEAVQGKEGECMGWGKKLKVARDKEAELRSDIAAKLRCGVA